ncbi:hypothetical protein MMPV_006415 [Pyropia vietnamensis]
MQQGNPDELVSADGHPEEMLLIYGVSSVPSPHPYSIEAMNMMSVKGEMLVEIARARRFVEFRGAFYFFSTQMMCWYQICTTIAATELLDLLDITAPVNFAVAFSRFIPLIKRLSIPIADVPKSVCIATDRLTYAIDPDTGVVRFEACTQLILTTMERVMGTVAIGGRQSMFCTSSVQWRHIPRSIAPDPDSETVEMILMPLRPDQRKDLLWRLGAMVVDGGARPSVIVLYGPTGSEGKSSLMISISEAFPGTMMWVSRDLIGSKPTMPSQMELASWAQCRGIVCDGVSIRDGMNYDCIRRWTSNSPVEVNGMHLMLRQTIFAAANDLGFMERSAMTNSIGRRLVIYSMSRSFAAESVRPARMIPAVAAQIMAMALTEFEASPHPPTSLEIALLTVFRKSVGFITGGLIIDPHATPDQCRAATTVIKIRVGVEIDEVTSVFEAINPKLVGRSGEEWRTPYIKGIRCRVVRVTEEGKAAAACYA